MRIALCFALSIVGLAAHADPLATLSQAEKADLVEALHVGQAAFDDGRFAEALAAFERGLGISPLPDLHYRRAQCLERLDRPGPAAAALREMLRLAPQTPDRGRVEAEIARLEAIATARASATLKVGSSPAGAEVRLYGPSGRLLGQTPLSARIAVGTLKVHVSAAGHRPKTQAISARGGQVVALEVALVPIAPPPPDHRGWGWSLAGTGVALALGAGALAIWAEDAAVEANAYDRRASGHTRGALIDLEDEARALQAGVWITGAAALIAGAAGVWLLWPDQAIRPTAGPGGLAIEGRF